MRDCFFTLLGNSLVDSEGAADQKSAGRTILKHLRDLPGAAFGAALYRDLVHSGATRCDVDNMSMSFIM
jgi:hypothetical protein